MEKAVGLYLTNVAVTWFIIFTVGCDLDLKEKIGLGLGVMFLLVLIGIGDYLLTGGM